MVDGGGEYVRRLTRDKSLIGNLLLPLSDVVIFHILGIDGLDRDRRLP
jgi:hypothetical protein